MPEKGEFRHVGCADGHQSCGRGGGKQRSVAGAFCLLDWQRYEDGRKRQKFGRLEQNIPTSFR